MREAKRNEIKDQGIKNATRVLEAFETVGETRWSAIQVLQAISGEVPNHSIISAGRSAIGRIKYAQQAHDDAQRRAKQRQAEAAATYID